MRDTRDYNATLRRARALGATIETARRTGEYVISHPSMGRTCRMNLRRGDAPAQLLCWLRQLERLTNNH